MSSVESVRSREVLVAEACTIELRSNRGDHEFLFLHTREATDRSLVERLVRNWGDGFAAASVWYQIEGCEPERLDIANR